MTALTKDSVGNRLNSLGVSPYTYDSSNHLTSTPGVTFTYDDNGNLTSKTTASGTTSYTWDFENRLTSVTLPGDGTVSFDYDPFGRRIRKVSSASTSIYAYDGASIIEEVDGNGAVVARYTQGLGIDEPLAMLRGGTTHYYQADGLGSVTSLTDAAGSIAASYTYDSFGNLIASTGSVTNPFRYTAREFDSQTGLYYYRERYYDQAVGRFAAEDPVGFTGGMNFYEYVRNNPTNLVDPLGLRPKRWPWARTRPCNGVEYSACAKICGSRGVESCRVSQTFTVIRWTNGKTVWGWKDGPMSCSCNELSFCSRNPGTCLTIGIVGGCVLVLTPWPDEWLVWAAAAAVP